MPKREQLIATAAFTNAPAPTRIDDAWELVGHWLAPLNIGVSPAPLPGRDKSTLLDAMAVARRPLTFVAVFDGRRLGVEARVGVVRKRLFDADLAGAANSGDVGQRETRQRAIELLMKHTTLVRPEDVVRLDRAPGGPSQREVLQARVAALDILIALRSTERDRLLKTLQGLAWPDAADQRPSGTEAAQGSST